MTTKSDRRKTELARIHALKNELGLDDDTYRDLLEQVTGARSAGALDERGRAKVLDRLRSLGAKGHKGTPHNLNSPERGPLLQKIEALLADQRLPWSYAVGIARQMYGREKLEFCDQNQLRGVVTALVKRQKKESLS